MDNHTSTAAAPQPRAMPFETLIPEPTLDNCTEIVSAAICLEPGINAGFIAIAEFLCSVGANSQKEYELDPRMLFNAGWLIKTLAELQERLSNVGHTARALRIGGEGNV